MKQPRSRSPRRDSDDPRAFRRGQSKKQQRREALNADAVDPRNPRDSKDPRDPRASRGLAPTPGSSKNRSHPDRPLPAPAKPSKKKLDRFGLLKVAVLGMTGVIAMRMAWFEIAIQPKFAEQAAQQRTRVFVDPARRGEIRDRQGRPIAYTMQARSLTVSPNVLRRELQQEFFNKLLYSSEGESLTPEQREKLAARKVDEELIRYASEIPNIIGSTGASTDGIDSAEVLEKLRSDASYAVLVRNVDPDIAADIAREYYGIASDHQDVRQYPNGAIGANVIGKISQDGQGQFGFEASNDSLLSGINGRSTTDVSRIGSVIPGTQRDKIPAINGAAVTLTLDLDLQTFVQQQLEQAKANSLAKSASAVVLDVETGEVLAMANTDTIDPTGDIQAQLDQGKDFGNSTISAPFEPGSVAKIITAAGVIEDNLSTPDEVFIVPGSIDMSGVNVRDAWVHGPVPYTTTGIFGKSSNVGTLMLAQRLGEQRFDDLLTKFGIGEATGIELPSESQGLRPEFSQWSGGTFANLPIGQGMSLTLLQMASVYQALANGGERIQPRIIAKVEDAQGTIIEQPEPKKVRVVKPATARTVIDMFRAVIQKDPAGIQQGTGAGAAIEGYQISGKTGTAQQVDPNTGAYSHSNYWITFAGVAPADNPRFVVALMLDRPQRGVHGEGGQSAAPLFKDIASWLLDRDNVPLSPPQEGQLILQMPE